jgi:hypothetical protein
MAYLSKFDELIGKTQIQQIVSLLTKQRNAGQIQTLGEFTARFEKLIREITSNTLTPMTRIFQATQGTITSAEQWNFTLDRVQDDLTAAFTEADNIASIQEAHRAVIQDNILKNLRASINELETKISVYEFFHRDTRGFSEAVFSTFREITGERTTRGNPYQLQFWDPRRLTLISSGYDAMIDPIGERLVSSFERQIYHRFQAVQQLFSNEALPSMKIVSPPGVKLNNIIDGQKGTYWSQSVLVKTSLAEIKTQLELSFNTIKEVNFLEIEPMALHPIILDEIQYLDTTGNYITLLSPNLTIEGPVSLVIPKISTRVFLLTFRNQNHTDQQFQSKTTDPLFQQWQAETSEGYIASLDNVADEWATNIINPTNKSILGVTPLEATSNQYYEFAIGLDNIRAGVTTYDDISCYISEPLTVSCPTHIGLKTIESRPYLENNLLYHTAETYNHLVGDTKFFVCSIEHWLVRQDLDTNDHLVNVQYLPIAPLETSRINHERLILSSKSDSTDLYNNVGSLMFYTSLTEGDITVYRNGQVYPYVPNINLADGWTSVTTIADTTPNNSDPMTFKIQLAGNLPNDIFTVSYNPIVSTTVGVPLNLGTVDAIGGLQVVDLAGDLSARVVEGQVVILDKLGAALDAEQTRVFLMTILRRNTSNNFLTAAVEEFLLVGGNKDSQRIENVR